MALCYFEINIDIPNSHSLKDKRGIISSVLARVSKKYNISISEIDFNDVWKSSKLGVAIVAKDRKIFSAMIEDINSFISTNFPEIDITIVNQEIY